MNTETPHAIAAQIAVNIKTTPPFLIAQMQDAFSRVNTTGKEQEILDALPAFGVSAVQALGIYSAAFAFVEAIGQSGQLTAPNLEVFQPQEDGSVIYVAPPEPEPEPETVEAVVPA